MVILVLPCDFWLLFFWRTGMRTYRGIACTREFTGVRVCAPTGGLTAWSNHHYQWWHVAVTCWIKFNQNSWFNWDRFVKIPGQHDIFMVGFWLARGRDYIVKQRSVEYGRESVKAQLPIRGVSAAVLFSFICAPVTLFWYSIGRYWLSGLTEDVEEVPEVFVGRMPRPGLKPGFVSRVCGLRGGLVGI